MRNQRDTVNVAVVGGGLAGLTAAAVLAQRGQNVILLERASHLGGRAITKAHRGFHLNLGPHAWFVGGPGTDILRGLGVHLQGRTPKPAGAYAIHGERLHTLPIGFISLLTTGLLSLRGKMELARTLAALPGMNTSELDGITLAEWLHDAISDPVARTVLAVSARTATYVESPHLLSAGAALAQLSLALQPGVWYLDGGWQQIVDAVADRAWSSGARLRTSVPAREVVIDAGRVRGVRLDDGSVVEAEDVILAIPPDAARDMLRGTGLASWQTVAAKAACLDLALTRLANPVAAFAVGIDAPVYYSVHSAAASLAPAGQAVVHVAKYLDPLQPSDAECDEAELESVMDRLQAGWRSDVVVRRFLPSLTVTHAIPTAALGGVSGRPSVTVSGVAGLYLAGDWVGDEGQLANAAIASAARAADLIVRARSRQAA